MNQPPPKAAPDSLQPLSATSAGRSERRPAWRLPTGVAPGTWEYTQAESIAKGYREFIASTPLVGLDIRLLLESLPAPKPQRQTRVLDLGCGDGRALRAMWEAGFDALGVDLSQPMLRGVTTGDHGEALRNRLIRANLVELDCLRSDTADHACCLFSTIGMVRGRDCRRRFLQHVARIVRPGGMLVVHVHNRNRWWRDRPSARAWLNSLVRSLRDREHEWGDRVYAYRGLADMYLHTYSRNEIRKDLIASGWQVERLIPLAADGGQVLPGAGWLPGWRAGGFIALARRPQ